LLQNSKKEFKIVLGIFLDTETNGLNFHKHRVLEIAYKIIDLFTGELRLEFQTIVSLSPEAWQKSDPASLKLNGFTWEETTSGKSPSGVQESILASFREHGIKRGGAAFICQNPSFDRAFFSQLVDPDLQEKLLWPYHWLDLASMYWAESIRKGKENPLLYPWETGFSKDRISIAYKLPPEARPHRAMNGVNHLLRCYEAVVGYPGIIA
jgi:oligoribonuclease